MLHVLGEEIIMTDTQTIKKKRKFGSGFFEVLQRVGRAFMLPIALLPIAGLLLGIGASFTGSSFFLRLNSG